MNHYSQKNYLLFTFLLIAIASVQAISPKKDSIDGIHYTRPDSAFYIKFNTRFQSLYQGTLDTNTGDWSDQFLIRRLRLKFGGFVYNPKFEYKIELALSNRDQGGISSHTNAGANIVLDAVFKWHFAKNWSIWVGQAKLPGNRERVISSQQLQFVDRSNLNTKFNIDRDKGIQLRYEHTLGRGIIREMASISLGEGRNITDSNAGGYDYTIRTEYLPFGDFKDDGDYVASDLKREISPKFAIGITYDFNDGASRSQAQLNDFLDVNSDLETFFIDAMFKYNGFSFMGEYANRKVKSGVEFGLNEDMDIVYFYTGSAINLQAGYLFRNNFEIASRYTSVKPESLQVGNDNKQYSLGISKYISGHTLKVQSDITLVSEDSKDDQLRYRFQIEIGI